MTFRDLGDVDRAFELLAESVVAYVSEEVLDTLETGKGGELWLADAVDQLARRSTVVVHPIDGVWMAAGDPLRQLKACIEVSLRRDDMRDELVAYLRSLEI